MSATGQETVTATLEGVSLHVADVERSIEFYSRIPGAEMVVHRPGEFARFRIGTGYLHVVKAPTKQRFHIEMVTSDLNEMYERLRAVGIEPEGPPTTRPWGMTDMRVIDPDGNMLEFDGPDQ